MVLDGYQFNTEYQKTVMQTGCKLVCIDDVHSCHYVSHILINHSLSAKREMYSAEDYTKFFLGYNYALLRPKFQENAIIRNSDSFSFNNKIFICLGGADGNNEIIKVLSAILEKPNYLQFEFFIVVGSAYEYFSELNQLILSKDFKAHVYKDLDEDDLFKIMSSCSTAITSASTISIEFTAIGGLLYLIKTAENQDEHFSKMLELQLAFPFDAFPDQNVEQVAQQLYKKHCRIIDGKQNHRYSLMFKNLSMTNNNCSVN